MPENQPYPHHLDARHGSGDTSSREWDVNAEWSWPSDLQHEQHQDERQEDGPSTRLPRLPQTHGQAQVAAPRPQQQQPPPPQAQPSSSTPPTPYYHRQLPPLSHTHPVASLVAALRGEEFHPPPAPTTHRTGAAPSTRPPPPAATRYHRSYNTSDRSPPAASISLSDHQYPVASSHHQPPASHIHHHPPTSSTHPPTSSSQPSAFSTRPLPVPRINSQSGRRSSFGYIPDHFFHSPPDFREQTPPHTNTTHHHHTNTAGDNQTTPGPASASQPQSAESSNSATLAPADQTSPTTMPRASASSGRKRPRDSAAIKIDDSPKPKRQRRPSNVDEVDLSISDDDVPQSADQAVLDRERQELVKRQREESNRPVRLNDMTCMICLETFTNMSVTHCGHIFCHECLTQALNASERASERNVGTCPACRKTIRRGPTAKNQIIPLALMKRPIQNKARLRRPSRPSMN